MKSRMYSRREMLAGFGALALGCGCSGNGSVPLGVGGGGAGSSAAGGGSGSGGGNMVPGGLWPAQTPSYLSALPRHAGFGMDSVGGSGRDGAEDRTSVCFIDDLGSGTSGSAHASEPRTYYGSWKYFAGLPGPKVAIPIASGIAAVNDSLRLGSYLDYYGQFAPGDGHVLRGGMINTVISFEVEPYPVAVHQRIWHLYSAMGDAADGWGGSDPLTGYTERDGIRWGAGDNTRPTVKNILVNCAFMWSLDELLDAYLGCDDAGILYCAFIEPLHASFHVDEGTLAPEWHGYGPIIGTGNAWDRLSIQRSLFAHSAARKPYIAALRWAFVNNLIYNCGQPDNQTGAAVGISPRGNAELQQANLVGNFYQRGPNQSDIHRFFAGAEEGPGAGSHAYVAGNAMTGWPASSQADLLVESFPPDYLTREIQADAWPDGFGAAAEGVQPLGAAPPNLSVAEAQAFRVLMQASVGPKPGMRPGYDRVAVVMEHLRNAIDGARGQGGIVNSVEGTNPESGWPDQKPVLPNAGGWPSIETVVVDPFDPGPHWDTPIPRVAEGRDAKLTSGTFSNGDSRAGYTLLEAWAIERHWAVGGQ